MSTEFSTELALPALPAPGGMHGERTLNLVRLIRLRAPLMLVVFLALAVPSLAAAYLLVPEEYTASKTIRFAANPVSVLGDESGQGGTVNYDRWVRTQAFEITDATVMQRVLDDPDIRSLEEIRQAENPLLYLQDLVQARVLGGSENVEVVCTAPNQNLAERVLAATVKNYMALAVTAAVSDTSARRSTLVDEKEDLQKELDILRGRIKTMKEKLGVAPGTLSALGPSETEADRENLSAAEKSKIEANNHIDTLKGILDKIAAYKQQLKSSPQEPIFDLNIEEGTRADIEVNMIQQELAQAKSEIAVLEEKYTTEAPPLKALRNTQASLQGRLDGALAEARGRLLESAEARTRQELAVAEKALLEAETQIEQFQRRIEAQTELAVKAAGQQAGIEALQAEEADLADKIKHIESIIYSIDVESKAPGRISLTSNLFPPARADYGRRKQLMALAFLASACAAVAAGLWRELTDKQVRSAQDVAVLTGLPVLATVPHASLEQSNARHDGSLLQTAREPGSTSADQFRRILTRIIYPPEGSAELNTCLVVSPGRGDGKTSLACNLATALAQAGRRVLLVDINARNPKVEEAFGLTPGPGLGEVLFGDREPNDVVRQTDYANLFVIGPGSQRDVVVGKLASRDMVAFFEQAEQAFDHVIIDTPPALLMADAKLLAPVVDGVVVVIGVGASTTGMLQRCLNDMRQIGANVIGVVLNKVKATRSGYLRRNLHQYYDYMEEGRGKGRAMDDMQLEYDEDAPDATIVLVDAEDEGEDRPRTEG